MSGWSKRTIWTSVADAQLANISTRGFVDSGDNVMIGGFILGNGNANARVLIRAIGPSLTAFGVPNALADPTLELHNNNGAIHRSERRLEGHSGGGDRGDWNSAAR